MWRKRFGSRALVAGVGLAALVVGVPAAWANLPQAPVKTQPNPIREQLSAVSRDYFAWAQTSRLKPHHYNLFEQAMVSGVPSGRRTRVNIPDSQSFSGGISGTRLAYDQYVNGKQDIRYFNLSSHRRSNPPVGVNTSHREYAPSISPGWLMFGRYIHGTSRILLWNLATNHPRVLATVPLNSKGTAFADTGQVNGDYATFFVCTRANHCSIYLYTISTHSLVRIPRPAGTQDSAPAVSSTGTLYWDRSGPGCGTAAQLMELPLGGTLTTLNTFHPGTDFGTTQTYNDGANDQVFYTRIRCATFSEDIYQVTAP